MNRVLNVHLLPELADPHDLAGHCAVVIDVLRASTTIAWALSSGAAGIVPCVTVEEARQLASQRPGTLLGGERSGKRLPGFDFGNSPKEYVAARVSGRQIAFSTTNGTKAMTRCMGSARVVIGSLINRAAVCRAVTDEERIDLICAGTNGEFSMEDSLAAGAMVEQLLLANGERVMNDAARTAHALWRDTSRSKLEDTIHRIREVLWESQGGRNLAAIGLASDIEEAAELDESQIVPELDLSNWCIHARV